MLAGVLGRAEELPSWTQWSEEVSGESLLAQVPPGMASSLVVSLLCPQDAALGTDTSSWELVFRDGLCLQEP